MFDFQDFQMIEDVLQEFAIDPKECRLTPIGNGLINATWLVDVNEKRFILQRINTSVFQYPEQIHENLAQLNTYFLKNHPNYRFTAPLPAKNGATLIDKDGSYYRLFDYVENSFTITEVSTATQAYEAAKQFGRFSKLLSDFDATQLQVTIPDFHNLKLRYNQFCQALKSASAERLAASEHAILKIDTYRSILETFEAIQSGNIMIPIRVVHHDTKISNVLFDAQQHGICVIDLDTVMPGYYLSDVGDMMRSYLAQATEEETNVEAIVIRPEIFEAVKDGYLSEMGEKLTATEHQLFWYSGKFMIYMQALRFLTDFLNNDRYYGSHYEGHNLNRSLNQLKLLEAYVNFTDDLQS